MPIGRTKKTGNYVKSGDTLVFPASAAALGQLQPRSIIRDASGLMFLTGDPQAGNGVIYPIVAVNPVTSPASNGVFLRKIDAVTDVAVNIGGGAKQIRLRGKLVSVTTLLGNQTSGRVLVDVGPDATVIAAAGATAVNKPLLDAAGEGAVFTAYVDPGTGQFDVTVTFAAVGSKRVSLAYGPDLYSFTITAN